MKKLLFLVIFILIIAAIIAGTGYYFFEIRPTAIVLLKTDIDPLTAIRARHVALNYEISQIPFSLLQDGQPEDIQSGWSDSDIYVVLEKKGKHWGAVSAYKKRPRRKSVIYLWGRCNSKLHDTFYVRYNIYSLLLDEKTAQLIAKQKQDVLQARKQSKIPGEPAMTVDVEININCQGKARIKRIFINGQAYTI